MQTKLIITFLVIFFSLFSFTAVQADENDKCIFEGKVLPFSQIENNAKSLGYSVINTTQDDCVYKVKARDRTGQLWELNYEPISGKLIGKEKENDD